MYNTYMYMYVTQTFTNIDSTPWKAIIGMGWKGSVPMVHSHVYIYLLFDLTIIFSVVHNIIIIVDIYKRLYHDIYTVMINDIIKYDNIK